MWCKAGKACWDVGGKIFYLMPHVLFNAPNVLFDALNVLFNAPQCANVCIVIVFRFLTQPELATEVNDCLTLHVHEQAEGSTVDCSRCECLQF